MTTSDARKVAFELKRLMAKEVEGCVRDMAKKRDDDRMLDTVEAARFLGVSESWIYHRIDEVPHVKVGRKNLFKYGSLALYRDMLWRIS